MRAFLLLTLLTCFCAYAKGQQTQDELGCLNAVAAGVNPSDALCSDNADMAEWLDVQIKQYLEQDTAVHLSGPEKAELENKLLDAQQGFQWPGHTLNHIPLISSDTLKNIMADRKRGWYYLNGKHIHAVYTFAKPVLIRNNTIGLVYFSGSRHNATTAPQQDEEGSFSGELWICVKTGNGWIKKVRLFKMIT